MYCVETQNEYCLKYPAMFYIMKPNFANVAHHELFGKNILLNFAIGPFIALGCHQWATLFPSMDHMHNKEKCRTTRAVMYYIL